MKKIASVVLSIALAAILPMNQVFAQEITLDSAISNLQYRLTVEWDQKDAAAQKQILGEFASDLEQLKGQGVSEQQIFETLSSRAFDAQTAKDIQHLAQYAKEKKLDSKQIQQLVVDYANKSQKMGSSWSPEARAGLLLGIVLGVVLVAILIGGSSGPYYYNCYDQCYYDYWGYYYCDTYCY